MNQEKLDFLQREYINKLLKIPASQKAVFGKMNVHQMIEHMSWAFQIASGKIHFESKLPGEVVKKMYSFLMSEKPFKDNTPNANLPEQPVKPTTKNEQEAIEELKKEIEDFVTIYKNDKELRIGNPFFGQLNFAEQVQLLHKHALHHLRQFSAT